MPWQFRRSELTSWPRLAEAAIFFWMHAEKRIVMRAYFRRMRWIVAFAICALLAGCGVATQPESAKTVAAFDVPLPSEADRKQFLSVLREAAESEGMHVDVESTQDLARETKISPAFAKTMNAAVWRGANDDEAIASAMDQPDHLGLVWIMFSRGK